MPARTIAVGDTEYTFDYAEITNQEGMAVEKATAMTFDQWNSALVQGNMLAMTALVWLLQRRDDPGLRFNDVSFKIGELRFVKEEGDDDEQKPATARTDVVEGGSTAQFDAADPTLAEEASTAAV